MLNPLFFVESRFAGGTESFGAGATGCWWTATSNAKSGASMATGDEESRTYEWGRGRFPDPRDQDRANEAATLKAFTAVRRAGVEKLILGDTEHSGRHGGQPGRAEPFAPGPDWIAESHTDIGLLLHACAAPARETHFLPSHHPLFFSFSCPVSLS
jgi:hypothetical protein